MLTFDRTKVLGEGAFGIVYEGVWADKTKGEIKVAVKRIPINRTASDEREEKAMKMLDHINVNKLFHVEEDQDFKYFALELCFASLDQLFLKENDPKKCRVSMPPKQEILLQLAKGLEYIHEMKLVHRDIKPGNVLICIDPGNQQVVMKWGDFGLSKQVNENGTFTMSEVKGTFNYYAPEILKLIDEGSSDENDEKKRGTVKSDVFAEGLVFGYFVMDGVHPFGSNVQIPVNVQTKRPINLPKREETRSLIEKMLEKEPENRISSAEVVDQLMKIKKITISHFLKRRNANYVIEEFNILIQEGIEIDVDERGLTTLLHLVFDNNKKTGDVEGIVRFLIQNGANVNSKDEKGRNALQMLCTNHQSQFVFALTQLLIENGIDVNCKDQYGCNALHYLCQNYRNENLIDIIRLLIHHGIDVNGKENDGWNALHILCHNYKNDNLIDIIQIFIENGIDVNCKDNDGDNALQFLCTKYKNENLIDIIRLLIEKGIDVNCKGKFGYNPLYILCAKYENENLIDIIRILIEKGIDVNCKNKDGWNALRFLCHNYKNDNLIDIIRLLIENEIEVTSKTMNDFYVNYIKEDKNEILQLLGSKEDEASPAKRRKLDQKCLTKTCK